MIFAVEASQVDPTTIGAFVTIILAFLGTAKIMLTQADKERQADRVEREKFAKAIEHMAINSGKVVTTNELIAQAVIRQADESKQRNGHLGEQSQMIADLVTQGNETHHEILNRLNKSVETLALNTKSVVDDVHLVADNLAKENNK